MKDFGEYLVDIHDRLAVELPLRVQQWRVFVAACVEGFGLPLLFTIQRDYRLIGLNGMAQAHVDLDEVMREFQALNDKPASREQIERAQDIFRVQMQRRCDRLNQEMRLWVNALHSGMFLGTVLSLLIMVSMALCAVTDRLVDGLSIIGGYFVLQSLAAWVCLKGWHRP